MGSVIKNKRSKSGGWVAIYNYLDRETGEKKRTSKSGFATKKEARDFVDKTEKRYSQGYRVTDMTVKEFCEVWKKDHAEVKCAISTLNTYVSRVDNDIVPVLGKIKLNELHHNNIRTYFEYLGDKQLSKQTIKHHHRLLHLIFECAVKWRYLQYNPMKGITTSNVDRYEAKIWDENTMKSAITSAKGDAIELPLIFALYLGMRRGEILALQYKDIDYENRIIRVRHSLQKVDNKLELKDPKTKSSKRDLFIPEELLKIIKANEVRQKKNKLALGAEYKESDFVITKENGEQYDLDYVSRRFSQFIKKHNLPVIRFHDLRHTHASMLLKLGISHKVVSEQLGHSSIQTTMDIYSHVVPSLRKEVADTIDKVLSS